jgi:DNA-binding SARP family transcriptional activator
MLELQTLGDLRITVDGHPAALRSRKAQALLVYLAIEGEPQPRASMATLLWTESDQQHADTNLRVALTALNKACQGYLTSNRRRIGIDWGKPVSVDLNELLRCAEQADNDRALDLYKGPFLAGFHLPDSEAFETWRTWQNERLLRVITRSFQRAINCALQGGIGRDPIALSQQLLKIDPLDEIAHRAIMITHWRNGNHAAALEQYRSCLNLLHSELAADPSDQTRSLYERIQRGEAPATEPPLTRRATIPQKRPLIGREAELGALLERIGSEQCRLVTLLGPGGIGKSRLAIEALRKAADRFPDGAFFCPLASISAREFLLPAIASTLGFYVDSIVTMLDPKSQLLDFLATRRILLTLDGFEHLVGCADLLADFLAHAPGLMLLVTSRERLQLSDEWELPLKGLTFHPDTTPGVDPRSPALELFEQRMMQASGDRTLDGPERKAAQEICALVDGNPLAIELAAAWSGALAPSTILKQMQVSLDVLTARHRDLPEQHHSLRAVFNHSWDLLPDHLKSIFAALSVFRGNFGPHAAEAVAGATLKDLIALADRSLVWRNLLGRYELHALLNEYASSTKSSQRRKGAISLCLPLFEPSAPGSTAVRFDRYAGCKR